MSKKVERLRDNALEACDRLYDLIIEKEEVIIRLNKAVEDFEDQLVTKDDEILTLNEELNKLRDGL